MRQHDSPKILVAHVTVSGGAGALSGVSGANGYSAFYNGFTHTATVAVPLSFVSNSGTQEAGLCIHDKDCEDGIQAPFKILPMPIEASEALGYRNLSEATGQCNATSHPVNCEFGNFWHTFSDFAIPDRGLPLGLSRTYNSLNASYNGMFGYG